MKIRLLLPLILAIAACLGVSSFAPVAAAQEDLDTGPDTLVIQYRASLENRAAFRTYLATKFAPKLRAMKAKGELADFRIFYSWYRQPDVWDGLVVLRFPSHAGVTRWNMLERTAPGGLDAAGMALADPVATYATALAWSRNPDSVRDGEVYYIIPYEYQDANVYRDYLKGYVVPQFDGWVETGAVTGYEIYMNRYSVGKPWDALFIQHYRDMEAFGQRHKILEGVRVKLREIPSWKAWSDKKQGIRTESENSIAELIAH